AAHAISPRRQVSSERGNDPESKRSRHVWTPVFRSIQRNRRRIHPKFIGAAEIVYTLLRTPRTRHERAFGPPGRLDRQRTPHAPTAARRQHRPTLRVTEPATAACQPLDARQSGGPGSRWRWEAAGGARWV